MQDAFQAFQMNVYKLASVWAYFELRVYNTIPQMYVNDKRDRAQVQNVEAIFRLWKSVFSAPGGKK